MGNFILSFLMISLLSFSQQVPVTDSAEFRTESRLFTLRFVPGDKAGKLFFAGKEIAKIDFEKDHKVLEITAFAKGKKEVLQFKKDGEAYTIQPMPGWNEPYELDIKTQTRGQIENTRVPVKNKP